MTKPFHPEDLLACTVHIMNRTSESGGLGSGVIVNLAKLGFTQPISIEIETMVMGPQGQPQLARQKTLIGLDEPLIVTCAHVVRNARRLMIRTNGNKMYASQVLVIDNVDDVALLRVEDPNPTDFNAIEVGVSHAVRAGDEVWIVGSPRGLDFSLGKGQISHTRRFTSLSVLPGFQVGPINPGNSGGLLADSAGRWIGINYAGVRESESLGFALHVDDVLRRLKGMLEEGHIIRPVLGVHAKPVDLMIAAACKCSGDLSGAFVDSVTHRDSEAMPLKPLDIVRQVNGDEIHDLNEFRYALFKHAGEKVTFVVWRRGQKVTFDMEVKAQRLPFSHWSGSDAFGLYLYDDDAHDMVSIAAVSPGSLAEAIGLQRGMMIAEVQDPDNEDNFIKVATPKEFYDLVRRHGKSAFFVKVPTVLGMSKFALGVM